MTGMPAQRFGLAARGLIRKDYAADLVLFDPETILDTATFSDPIQPAVGINSVWVNGTLSYTANGATGNRAGRFIPRERQPGSNNPNTMIDSHSTFPAHFGLDLGHRAHPVDRCRQAQPRHHASGHSARPRHRRRHAAAYRHSFFEVGVGGTLGHIAIIVALGTMLGKMMAESGAADQIAHTLVHAFGEKNLPWAMLVIALIVGLPAFFEVGFVLLIPFSSPSPAAPTPPSSWPACHGRRPLRRPRARSPASRRNARRHRLSRRRRPHHPLRIAHRRAHGHHRRSALRKAHRTAHQARSSKPNGRSAHTRDQRRNLPGFWLSVLAIVLPVMLMLIGSWADTFSAAGSSLNGALRLVGNDDMALLIGVLFSFITLGVMRGFSRETVLRFSNECLGPTAAITLLVGAGGGFGRVLQDCGVSAAIIAVALKSHVPLLLLAWLLAAAMRLATGSATVAMATAASIVAPIALHTTGVHPELLAIGTGAGALIFLMSTTAASG